MTEYYRDARDFQAVHGAVAVGEGYGYDAGFTSWLGAGHGCEYEAATHLSARGPTDRMQYTIFGDGSATSEGEAIVNQMVDLVSGSYYVWLLVGGGGPTALAAHSVQVGGAVAVAVVSSATPDTPVWKQVGSGLYTMDDTTYVTLSFFGADGYYHAIRAICLKTTSGAPSQTPAGNTGDRVV